MATHPISGRISLNSHLLAGLGVAAICAALVTQDVRIPPFSFAGAPENASEAEQRIITDSEKRELIKLTVQSPVEAGLAGEEAEQLNGKIPFSKAPVLAARPFKLPQLEAATKQTALKCLTQAIYYEAGFEPVEGRRAVAQVVLNRMRHPAFPKSICGVVYQGANEPVCQFSFTCDGSLLRAPQRAAWLAAETIARSALNGYVEPSVGQSTHYHAGYVAPYWAPQLVKLAQIGAHIFYRWPGSWGMPSAFAGRYQGIEAVPLLSMHMTRSDMIDEQTKALAIARLPANLVPVRHARNDIGGRLDVSRGWTLDIPDPAETRKASAAAALKQQAADGADGEQKTTGKS